MLLTASRPLLLALALVAVAGCDTSTPEACGDVAESVAEGTFDFQFEEVGGCFSLTGERARYGVRLPSASNDQTVFGQFLPDDPEEQTDAGFTFVQFLAVGDAPLAVGTYEIADLYVPSTATLNGQPIGLAGDVRLEEYPGQVALQAGISTDENLYSRSGTLTVTSSGPDGFAGQIDAVLAQQVTSEDRVDTPGAEVRIRGAFSIDGPGASFITFL